MTDKNTQRILAEIKKPSPKKCLKTKSGKHCYHASCTDGLENNCRHGVRGRNPKCKGIFDICCECNDHREGKIFKYEKYPDLAEQGYYETIFTAEKFHIDLTDANPLVKEFYSNEQRDEFDDFPHVLVLDVIQGLIDIMNLPYEHESTIGLLTDYLKKEKKYLQTQQSWDEYAEILANSDIWLDENEKFREAKNWREHGELEEVIYQKFTKTEIYHKLAAERT